MNNENKKLFGELLLEAGFINEEQLEEAIETQKNSGGKIGEVLINKGIISYEDVIQVLEFQVGIPHANLHKVNISKAALEKIPEKFAKKYMVMPIIIEENKLTVAMTYPLDLFMIDDLKLTTGMDIIPNIAFVSDIRETISKYYSEFKDDKEESDKNIKEKDNSKSKKIDTLLNDMLRHSIENHSESIHIEAFDNEIIIKFRINGSLREYKKIEIENAFIYVDEIMNKYDMNISEIDVPQNTVVPFLYNDKSYIQKTFYIPTIEGRKLCIKLSDSNILSNNSTKELGLYYLSGFNSLFRKKKGLILFTGPIGSGKTTTLYYTLEKIKDSKKNIISIEEYSEKVIDGITQIKMNPKLGFTYMAAINKVLKQDPDVLSLGDINDKAILELAFSASSAGKLVLGTMYSEDSVSLVSRLLEMGILPYTIVNNLKAVISQRMINVICKDCKVEYTPSEDEIHQLKDEYNLIETDEIRLSKGEGCEKCRFTGYKEKTAVFEVLVISDKIKNLILENDSLERIEETISIEEFKTIKENVVTQVLNGITTFEELINLKLR